MISCVSKNLEIVKCYSCFPRCTYLTAFSMIAKCNFSPTGTYAGDNATSCDQVLAEDVARGDSETALQDLLRHVQNCA